MPDCFDTVTSALDPLLGIPVVCLVDDEVVRNALVWLLRSSRLLSEPFASAETRCGLNKRSSAACCQCSR